MRDVIKAYNEAVIADALTRRQQEAGA